MIIASDLNGTLTTGAPALAVTEWIKHHQPDNYPWMYKYRLLLSYLQVRFGWTEIDIWKYIQRENIPTVSLYFAKGGKRFRSIGCETCCAPVDSNADTIKKIVKELETTQISERSGRAQDKEDAYTMQKLRSLGYM